MSDLWGDLLQQILSLLENCGGQSDCSISPSHLKTEMDLIVALFSGHTHGLVDKATLPPAL